MTLAPARRALCRRCAWIAAALSLLLGAGLLPEQTQGAAIAARQSKTHTVTIEATSFKPESLTVAAGDKVDLAEQRSVSSHGDVQDRVILIPATSSPRSPGPLPTVKKGEFGYICSLHPTMKAVLKVE